MIMGNSGEIPDLKSLRVPPFTISLGRTGVPPQGTRKNTWGLGPIKSALSRSPQSRGSYRKHPNGGHSIPSSIHRFPQIGGNRVAEAPEVVFDLTQVKRVWKPLLPMTP